MQSLNGHTTTCYCQICGCVHANDTLKRGELDTVVLDGLKEFFGHPVVRLCQVVELNPTRVTISIEEAVEVVVIRLYCNGRLYRCIIPGGCRSRGVPRTPRCGGPVCSSCTGSLGCRWADLVLVGRGCCCASALSSSRHIGVQRIGGSVVVEVVVTVALVLDLEEPSLGIGQSVGCRVVRMTIGRVIEELVVLRSMLRWVLWTVRWQGRRRKVASGEGVEKVVAVRFALAGLPRVVVGVVVEWRGEKLLKGLGGVIGGGVGERGKVTWLLTRVLARG